MTLFLQDNVSTELEIAIPLSDAYLLKDRGFIGENLKGEAVSDAGLTYAKRKEVISWQEILPCCMLHFFLILRPGNAMSKKTRHQYLY